MNQIKGHIWYKLDQRSEDIFQENALMTRLLTIWRDAVSSVEAVVMLEQMRTVYITDLRRFAKLKKSILKLDNYLFLHR